MTTSTEIGTLTLEPEGSGIPARTIGMTLGATGIVTAAGVATGILTARVLGPEGRGQLAALTLWAATIVYSTSFGIGEATGFCAAKAAPERRSVVLATSQTLALGYAVLAVICAWVVRLALAERWPTALSGMFVPYVVLFAIPGVPALSLVAFLQGTGRMRWFNVARTSVHAATLGTMILCVAVGATTVRALAIATLVGNAMVWLVARLGLRERWPRPTLSVPVLRQLLSYGARVQFGSWSAMANVRLDQLILALLVPFSSLGLYVVAVTYCGALNIVSSALSLIMLPAVTSAPASGHPGQAFTTLTRWTNWACVGAAVILAGAAPMALTALFGDRYQDSRAFVPILLPASVILGLNQVLASGLRALGAPETASKGEVLGFVVTIVGLAVLVPMSGAMGAAWTSLSAYSATCVYLLTRSKPLVGFRLSELLRPSQREVASLKSLFHAAAAR
jgi:O-antigen/teichoic acid export membrane protein